MKTKFSNVVLALAFLAAVTPLHADNPPTYLFRINAAELGKPFDPGCLALDSSNNVYVGNGVIDIFTSEGAFLKQWGTTGSSTGQFENPSGIAVDSSNNIYVLDGNDFRVEKFNASGNYLAQWGGYGSGNSQFSEPQGIAVDSSNNVYVADAANARIQKFDSKGNYLRQWGSGGSGNGQFAYPLAIAVDSANNVYVSDSLNSRIQKFTANGVYLTQWGSYGSGNGQFQEPEGIALDNSNDVYVVDSYNDRIEKFDSNGNYLAQWGSYGFGDDQFFQPTGIAVQSTGYFIYVVDDDSRIEVFVNDTYIGPPIITSQPTNAVVQAGGNLTISVGIFNSVLNYQWRFNDVAVPGATNAAFTLTNVSVADAGVYSVLVTNSFGSTLSSNAVLTVLPATAFLAPIYLFQWGSYGTNNGQFNGSAGITIDSSNNVYVVDTENNRVQKFDSYGNYLTQWGSQGTGNGQFEYPYGVAIDSSNDVYVVDSNNNRVQKFDSNGNYLRQWGSYGTYNGQFYSPAGIAVDSSNNIYVTDESNNRIEKFNDNGQYIRQWGSVGSGNGQFNGPNGIAIDSSNNIYVADYENNRIQKFDSNGTYLTQWGSGNGQFQSPVEIAVDGSNNIYVADYTYRIQKFDSNGDYLAQWASDGVGGIAVGSTGNFIYESDPNSLSPIQVYAYDTNIIPPIITSQPRNQTVQDGINVTISAGLVGTAPLACQWMFNNIALPGATNATITLTNVSLADSGNYSVLVTNNFGSAFSSNAILSVVPALVATLPASSLSATGAVLNGSIILGSDETVVWFDWGTDTNYGNIAGTTVLPGDSGSKNLNAPLSGLSGNVYHYRLDAANDYGIVYGNDQSFTNGFAPQIVTNFTAVGAANGVNLNATVNPNGWDTTVYFKWGHIGSLTNSTPVIDLGAGTVPVDVSSLLTGVAQAASYSYQVVASNYLRTLSGAIVNFLSPPFVSVPNEDWDCVASSADGRILVAVSNPGPIYISTNSGALWTQAGNAPTGRVESVACSADGSKIIAAGGGGLSFVAPIYTSSDMGATWVSNNAPVQNWQAVASSADGTKLVAAGYADRVIYTSTNSGAIWTQATNAPALNWYGIASSADGSKLAAVADGYFIANPGATNIYTSTDFGATWITNHIPKGPNGQQQFNWSSIASSADGKTLIAAGGGNAANSAPGYIFISTNAGAAWMVTATNTLPLLGHRPWQYVAISADGSKLAAVADWANQLGGGLLTSTNSGATWMINAVLLEDWNAVALSADGNQLVASIGYPATSSYIYVSQTTPAPVLSLAPAGGNVALSWLIPSLPFTLQQSSDLYNWSAATNLPALNSANLQNQVLVPPSGENNFYRLVSP